MTHGEEQIWRYLMSNPGSSVEEIAVAVGINEKYVQQVLDKSGESQKMKNAMRVKILDAAKQHISVDRNSTHGEAEDSFSAIAGHWTWWLSDKLSEGTEITAYDVAQMMVGFKQARMRNNPKHIDSAEDLCGYGALAGEIGVKSY
jgi:hypothetical protein